MPFSIFKKNFFSPDFPIIPLKANETEAFTILRNYGSVNEEDPEPDSNIAQKVLVVESEGTRIDVGIWDGKVRFTNYLTDKFNSSDKLKAIKLDWFIDHYGGWSEFEGPNNTGYLLMCPNPKRNILVMLGLHCGPIRIIDQDPNYD